MLDKKIYGDLFDLVEVLKWMIDIGTLITILKGLGNLLHCMQKDGDRKRRGHLDSSLKMVLFGPHHREPLLGFQRKLSA